MGARSQSALKLSWTFLRIGALAFGGLGATLALIERELVDRQNIASKQDVTDALTYTKLLPGSTAVQVVAFLTWRLGGWAGSALATVAFVFPAAVAMLALAYGYSTITYTSSVVAIRRGVLAVVVALLLLTMFRLARPTLTTPVTTLIALAAFGLVAGFQVSAALVVVTAGTLAVGVEWRERHAAR